MNKTTSAKEVKNPFWYIVPSVIDIQYEFLLDSNDELLTIVLTV